MLIFKQGRDSHFQLSLCFHRKMFVELCMQTLTLKGKYFAEQVRSVIPGQRSHC